MGTCIVPQKTKLFFAVMTGDTSVMETCQQRLAAKYGSIDLRDDPYDFDALTPYYAKEFGTNLCKAIFAVEPLIEPNQLRDIKIETNELEWELTEGSQARTINIDPGYLNHSKVVLATTKDQAHRIYVGQGILEEVTLNYRRVPGEYTPNPWTYADYRMPERIAFFGRLRQLYCTQMDAEKRKATT